MKSSLDWSVHMDDILHINRPKSLLDTIHIHRLKW